MIASQNDRDIEMKPVGIDSRRVFLCLSAVLARSAAVEERCGISVNPLRFPMAAEVLVAAAQYQRVLSVGTVHSAWMINRAVLAACGHVPEPKRQHQQSSQSGCASWRIGGGLLSGIIPGFRCSQDCCSQDCRSQDLRCPLLVGQGPYWTPLFQRARCPQ